MQPGGYHPVTPATDAPPAAEPAAQPSPAVYSRRRGEWVFPPPPGEAVEATPEPPEPPAYEYRLLRDFVGVQKHGVRGWRLHTVTRDDDTSETIYIMERAGA